MEGGSGAGSAAQPADLDWKASEVTAPERWLRSPHRSGSRPWWPLRSRLRAGRTAPHRSAPLLGAQVSLPGAGAGKGSSDSHRLGLFLASLGGVNQL